MHIEKPGQAYLLIAGISQEAGQIANVIAVQRIEPEVPVVAVELVLSPQTLDGIDELEDVIVGRQVEHFAVVLTLQTPRNTFSVLGCQLHDGTLGYHFFAGAWHNRVEDDAVLVVHVKAWDDLGSTHIAYDNSINI